MSIRAGGQVGGSVAESNWQQAPAEHHVSGGRLGMLLEQRYKFLGYRFDVAGPVLSGTGDTENDVPGPRVNVLLEPFGAIFHRAPEGSTGGRC